MFVIGKIGFIAFNLNKINFEQSCLLLAPLLRISPILAAHGQWMTHGIECPLVQWQDGVGGEGEVQVLEGAGQEIGGLVVGFVSGYFIHIPNRSIPATLGLAVPLDGHCQLPGILAILRVVRESPQDEVGLGQFGSGTSEKYVD